MKGYFDEFLKIKPIFKKKLKILNLYFGIGGNRKLWSNKHEITAVELNPYIAKIYQDFFPDDTVIVGDAHKYLLDHFDEFDFIWSSPPCPSHSRINTDSQKSPCFPEMNLYQEIIMLNNNWYKGKFCIENVIPYYEPLIKPSICFDRHLFWSNFFIQRIGIKKEKPIALQTGTNGRYGFNLKGIKINNKRQILRNLVNLELGLHILNECQKII